MFAGVHKNALHMMERAGLVDEIGVANFFWSSDQAIVAAEVRANGAGDATSLSFPVGKGVPLLVNYGETRVQRSVAAQRRQRIEIRESGRAAAAFEQIASQVKALHLRPPAGPPLST